MSRKTKSCSSLSPTSAAPRPALGRKAACLLLAVLLAAQLLGGCAAARRQNSSTLRIGVALYKQDDTFISIVLQSMERQAQEAESRQDVKINLLVADGKSNQTTQWEQIDRFLEQGCDVLCVNIVDRTAAAVVIDKAQAAGVPVIFFNRQPVEEDIERWEQVYYVGARARESGVLQGEIVRDAWLARQDDIDRNSDGVLQYVMLEGEPGHQDALLRTQYSISVLAEAGIQVEKLASDTANWNRGPAAGLVSRWITEYDDEIEAIFANNDDMALGAIDALREAGIDAQDMPLIVGVDATPPALEAVQEGALYGTVSNPAEEIAKTMLQLALALKSGSAPQSELPLQDGHYIWLPYHKVTSDSAA